MQILGAISSIICWLECYRRHVKMLDAFHMRHLRYRMGIKWRDKITNKEVLQRAKMDSIEAMLMIDRQTEKQGDSWDGSATCSEWVTTECRNKFSIPELSSDAWSWGEQRKRYKDTLKQTLQLTGINTKIGHELAENRTVWRQAVNKGARFFEAERLKTRAHKRQERNAKEALDIKVQQNPASADFVFQTCGS